MTRKTGLGKGLDALIPGSGEPSPEVRAGAENVAVSQITPNPHQPRTKFDQGELDDLAASISEHGIIQPLIVTRGQQDAHYTLIAGERRWQAAKLAGLTEVPVIVREASPQELLELALIENVQRADLNPLEEAEAYQQLAKEFGLTQAQVADRVGKSRVAVTNTLSLLELAPAVKQALADGLISEGHGRALKGLSNQSQSAALNTVIKNDLNVRQTEELARKLKGVKPPKKDKLRLAPEITELQTRLSDSLGTKVNLKHSPKGGTITLHYYSDEELNALVDRLLEDSD